MNKPHGLTVRNGEVGFFVQSPYTDNIQFCVIGETVDDGQLQLNKLPQSGRINTRCLLSGKEFVVDVTLSLDVKDTTATDQRTDFFPEQGQRHVNKPRVTR